MTDNQYKNLIETGSNILKQLMPELNKISDSRKLRTVDNYRREEDCIEMAIVLGLYDQHIEGLLV
jgi:hypothetical protein